MNKTLIQILLSLCLIPVTGELAKSQISVKFKGPAEWISVYCYVWDPNDYLGVWPGTVMTAEGNGWYSISDATLPSGNFIFNNGTGAGAVQTVNQPLTTGEYCFATTGELAGTELEVEMVDCAGTGIISRNFTKIDIYPRLVDEILYVKSTYTIKRVKISSVTGACLLDIAKVNNDGSIFTGDLKPGIYFVSISFSDRTSVVSKIVKK